jgi:hypothetical protein
MGFKKSLINSLFLRVMLSLVGTFQATAAAAVFLPSSLRVVLSMVLLHPPKPRTRDYSRWSSVELLDTKELNEALDSQCCT